MWSPPLSQIDGTPITKDTDEIGQIEFVEPVSNSKKDGTTDFRIYCRFKESMKPGDPNFAGLAKGKTVTVRGHLTGAMSDGLDATLSDCVIAAKVVPPQPSREVPKVASPP